MNKVQQLDNLMKQYIEDDITSDDISDKIHPLYNTLNNDERKDLYSLVKDRDTNWKHALINLIQIHRNENATREEYNDVIIACFELIDRCTRQREKQRVIRQMWAN